MNRVEQAESSPHVFTWNHDDRRAGEDTNTLERDQPSVPRECAEGTETQQRKAHKKHVQNPVKHFINTYLSPFY